MKSQWLIILGLLFALLIALFAVSNVEAVEVDYLVGSTSTPLILVIVGSTLIGGLVVGLIGMFRFITLQRKVKQLEKQLEAFGQTSPQVVKEAEVHNELDEQQDQGDHGENKSQEAK